MTREKWSYLKHQADKHKVRVIRCQGVVYEVTKTHYAPGPSPLYSIEEVRPVDVPPFVEQEWREGITPVKPDDLIMRGVAGEEYPIGRELFAKTYRIGDKLPPDDAEPVAWRKQHDGAITDDGYEASCWRSKGYDVRPLYAHPPRDDWRDVQPPTEGA